MPINQDSICDALDELDHNSDTDWDSNGKPSLDRVRDIMGEETVTREMIDAATAEPFRRQASDGTALVEKALAQRGEGPSPEAAADDREDEIEGQVQSTGDEDDLPPAVPLDPESARALIKEGNDILSALDKEVNELGRHRREIEKEMDAAEKVLAKAPINEHALTVKAFLESQKREAQARVGLVAEAEKRSGMKFGVPHASQLDAAMAPNRGSVAWGRKRFPLGSAVADEQGRQITENDPSSQMQRLHVSNLPPQ